MRKQEMEENAARGKCVKGLGRKQPRLAAFEKRPFSPVDGNHFAINLEKKMRIVVGQQVLMFR
jgi:hypothetical protein